MKLQQSGAIVKEANKEILPGDKFGYWTVIKEVQMPEKRRHYLVECKCGTTKIQKGIRLRFGDSTKCRKCASTKHNMAYSLTYSIWECIMQRTTNPNHNKYKYYGERGITVCDEWRNFKNFLKDMGERPIGLEIDRIDNNLGYFKENCRWTTRSINLKNRRASRLSNYESYTK